MKHLQDSTKMNKSCTLFLVTLALSATPSFAGGVSQSQFNKEVSRLDAEDMRIHSGVVKQRGSKTVIEVTVGDHGKSQGRSEVYTKKIDIDVTELKGNTGDTGAKGDTGDTGAKGDTGADGQDYDKVGLDAITASITAMSTLQLDKPFSNQVTWSVGVGGQVDGDMGVAIGMRYGITPRVSGYATVGSTLNGGASYSLGISGQF